MRGRRPCSDCKARRKTQKVFTVLRLATTSQLTYNLIDANNVKILRKFYEPELVQIDVLKAEEEQ